MNSLNRPKHNEQAMIQSAIKKYLKKGGTIHKLKGFTQAPIPERIEPKVKHCLPPVRPTRRQAEKKASTPKKNIDNASGIQEITAEQETRIVTLAKCLFSPIQIATRTGINRLTVTETLRAKGVRAPTKALSARIRAKLLNNELPLEDYL